jgi:hypothetical protein
VADVADVAVEAAEAPVNLAITVWKRLATQGSLANAKVANFWRSKVATVTMGKPKRIVASSAW